MMQDEGSEAVAAKSNSALMEVVQAMHKLTLQEKAQLLQYLSRALQYGIRQEANKDISWEQFLDRTYGSLADDPIELPDRFKQQAQDKGGEAVADKSASALMEVVQAKRKLTLQEKAQLLEYLSRALQYGIRQEANKDISWEEFLDRTYGSLPDFTLEREQPEFAEIGEELE